MIRSTHELKGYSVNALDGEVGEVKDFLFDDREWVIRYITVGAGGWLTGRKLLLRPDCLEKPRWANRTFPVRMKRKEVEDSPTIAMDEPVSRRHEIELHKYYSWQPYWGPPMVPGPTGIPPSVEVEDVGEEEGDPHLRSAQEVIGYGVKDDQGDAGKVTDLLVDDGAWAIRYLVIGLGGTIFTDKEVLLSPDWTEYVSWSEKAVKIDLKRKSLEQSPAYDPAEPVNRQLEIRLYDYHGRPRYWKPID